MKLFNDSLFDDTIGPKATVVKITEHPDAFVGKYPYFGEMYTDQDIKNLINLKYDDGEISKELWIKLSGKKYRYPLTKESNNSVGSGFQDKAFIGTIASMSTQISILEELWHERLIKLDDYLNKTYIASGNTTGDTTSNASSTGSSNNKADGSNTGESTGSGTSDGNSTGESHNTGSSTGSGSSTNKSVSMSTAMPEASGLTGMYNPGQGLNPGTLGLDYVSGGAESASNDTSSNSSSDKSDSTTKSTSHNEDSNKNNSKGSYLSNADSTSESSSNSYSNSNGTSDSEGRSRDLISLSKDFQALNNKEKLVDFIYIALSDCLAVTVDTIDVSFWSGQEDSFTGEWRF